jgi:hypothetical protein
MALQFCDGFDSYGAAGDLMGKWSSYAYNSGPSDLVYLPTGGRFGGGALRIANASSYIRKKLATAIDELFVNAAVFPRAWPTSTTGFFYFEDSSGNGASLRMTSAGTILGTLLGTTSAATSTSVQAIALNQWNTLAIHYKCADSGGRWRVLLNGAELFNFTGDTRSSGGPLIDRIALANPRGGAGNEWDWDDVVVYDASGTNLNALITQDLKIETLRPTADSGSQAWSPSAGTDHYALVDEAAPLDSDYLSATAAGTRDLFAIADPAAVPQTAYALVVNARGRRTDVGAKNLRPLVKVNAAEDLAANLALSNQVATLQHPVYRNPDGAAPWTGTSLNAALIGIEVGT